MLGVAIRIGQHMGIHDESSNTKCTVFEAEMRRRLWWSLILFDNRIGEVSRNKMTMLAPTWDCRPPLNVSDFDLRPEMKSSPTSDQRPTETLFAVVRSEIGDFIRQSAFHLGFTNPYLKAIINDSQHDELATIEKRLEDKYLRFCAHENPLHFMTVWTTRSLIAKNHLLEHRWSELRSSTTQTETHRDAVISYALCMLDCDTKLMTSPLTTKYLWFVQDYFPFPAYLNLVQELRQRPEGKHTGRIWEAMSDNFDARSVYLEQNNEAFQSILSRNVLQAWEAREATAKQSENPLQLPRIIPIIRCKMALRKENVESNATEVQGNMDNSAMTVPMDIGISNLPLDMEGQHNPGLGLPTFPYFPGQTMMDIDMNQSDWTALDWNMINYGGL